MKMWLKIISIVLAVVVAATAIEVFYQEKKECCLCDSFRYHAPCLIDLETGKLIELDLYLSHETKVAELADPQPEMGIFSYVRIGNVTGMKYKDTKTAEFHIPDEKTYHPALCSSCRWKLPLWHTSRYVLADLYDMEDKVLLPIKAGVTFSLRCYDITTEKNTEEGGISVFIQGTLKS